MRLYLVRHGEALASHPSGDRPLSDRGRLETERMAEFVRRAGVGVTHVAHSGKARAAQTAETLAQAMEFDGTLEIWTGLKPNDPVTPIADRVTALHADAMLVGHLPFMAALMGRLISGEERPVAEFQSCAVACLVDDGEGGWRIEWMVHPGVV